MEINIFNRKTHYRLLFSIAMWNCQRVEPNGNRVEEWVMQFTRETDSWLGSAADIDFKNAWERCNQRKRRTLMRLPERWPFLIQSQHFEYIWSFLRFLMIEHSGLVWVVWCCFFLRLVNDFRAFGKDFSGGAKQSHHKSMAPQRQRHEHCHGSWPPMAEMRGLFASFVSRKSRSQVAPRQGESIAEWLLSDCRWCVSDGRWS